MQQLSLIRNENMKLYRRFRTWAFLAFIVVLTLVPIFMQNSQSKNGDWKAELEKDTAAMRQAMEMPELSDAARASIQNKMLINEYRITNDLKPFNSAWGAVNELSFFISVVTLFTIIAAAEAVAGEFSAGTMKMLLTRPVSRGQILLSKYLSTVLYGLFLLIVLFTASFASGVFVHGFAGIAEPYLFVKNGVVKGGSMAIHSLSVYALKSVHLLMLLTLAFMISAVFRSVNMSITISMLLLFTGNVIVQVLGEYDWVKYLLFANTDLTQYMDGGMPSKGMNLSFSIIVLAIYFLLFHLISWITFGKRDVSA